MEKGEVKEDKKKLTYEQLEAYTSQIVAKAQTLYKENATLKELVNSKEIELALKCLDHVDLFSKDFISAVTKRIEEILNPITPQNTNTETKEEE